MPLNFPKPDSFQTRSSRTAPKAQSQSDAVAAFTACYEKLEDCLEFAGSYGSSPLVENAASFVLDFDIISKRAIGSDAARYRLFEMHFLRNANRQACCEKLQMTEWAFASEILAIKKTLGAAFTAAGLFPLAPYFSDSRPASLAA